MISVDVERERWPIAGSFVIARGAKTSAEVIVVTLRDGEHAGRGECVPYRRYGETPDSVTAQIEVIKDDLAAGDTAAVRSHLPAGAALNAVDCALLDLAAKRAGVPVCAHLGLAALQPVTTAYTLSLGTPQAMADAARTAAAMPLLKLKLGGERDEARMRSVRAARPDARLIVDANEAWTPDQLAPLLQVAAEIGVEVVEQPLPADDDMALADLAHSVPVCADESVHHAGDVAALRARYDAVNVKLDKAGGLTGALELVASARAAQMQVMVGCMVGTSLGMAPAVHVAQDADWVDLDGPLLLSRDRVPGLRYDHATLYPPLPELWG